MKRVDEESEVFFSVFLEPALTSGSYRGLIVSSLTRIESNRLFSFIASYTFSGTKATFLESRRSRLLLRGVCVPFAGPGSTRAVPAVEGAKAGENSRKKMILDSQRHALNADLHCF